MLSVAFILSYNYLCTIYYKEIDFYVQKNTLLFHVLNLSAKGIDKVREREHVGMTFSSIKLGYIFFLGRFDSNKIMHNLWCKFKIRYHDLQ
jgi:hypothetical protein